MPLTRKALFIITNKYYEEPNKLEVAFCKIFILIRLNYGHYVAVKENASKDFVSTIQEQYLRDLGAQ